MTDSANTDQHRHDQAGDPSKMIELEAIALRGLTDQVTAWVAETITTPPHHLLDLGSGTGAGTFALMERFEDARVTAVDSSSQMLARLEERGSDLGCSGRLNLVRADLEGDLPTISDVDLVWASSALHHLKNPDRLLSQIAALLPEGGWFFVVEAHDVAWFLPDVLGFGRPGLETRCHQLLSELRSAHLPHAGADWTEQLTSAGFDVRAEKVFVLDEDPARLSDTSRRFAQGLFRMLRSMAQERLDAEDTAVLDILLDGEDPRSLAQRDDLTIRTERTAWAARRPAGPDA